MHRCCLLLRLLCAVQLLSGNNIGNITLSPVLIVKVRPALAAATMQHRVGVLLMLAVRLDLVLHRALPSHCYLLHTCGAEVAEGPSAQGHLLPSFETVAHKTFSVACLQHCMTCASQLKLAWRAKQAMAVPALMEHHFKVPCQSTQESVCNPARNDKHLLPCHCRVTPSLPCMAWVT